MGGGDGAWRGGAEDDSGENHTFKESRPLTLYVLYHTIPHELCRCEVKDVHSLQSFVSTYSEKSEFAFHRLFAITNAFNICIFER